MRAGVSDDLLELLSAAVRAADERPRRSARGRSLYVGPADTLAPCHWTDWTIACAVQGRKTSCSSRRTQRAAALPADHPYDSRAQANIERPDAAARPSCAVRRRRAARGWRSPPHHWYHHIHRTR